MLKVSSVPLRIRLVYWSVFLLAVTIIAIGSSNSVQAASYTEFLGSGGRLNPGDSLWSPDRRVHVDQQWDGNFVLYAAPGNKPLWASNTTRYPGSATFMQGDGNLVIRAPGNVPVWASNTNRAGSALNMQNDANLVIRAPGNIPVWATGSQTVNGCTDGSRAQAEQYAASGSFYVPVQRVHFTDPAMGNQSTSGWVELRYNPHTRCAWGLASAGMESQVYLDRSTNAGATWQGWLNTHRINSTTLGHTGVLRDSFPYVVRACVNPSFTNGSYYHCTGWF